MLKYLAIIGAVLVASPAYAQSSASGPVPVVIDSEVKDLAQGYARAADRLSQSAVTLGLQRDGAVLVLEDVKGVQAIEGILAVEVGKGVIYLINPRDVIYITDGYKLTPKPSDAKPRS